MLTHTFLILASLLAFAPKTRADGVIMSGEGTYYNTGDSYGACGSILRDTDKIVAVSHLLYDLTMPVGDFNPNHALVCGRTICATGPNGTLTVTVADRCTGCKFYDLDFTEGQFPQIGAIVKGRVPITWKWCDDGPVILPPGATTTTTKTNTKTPSTSTSNTKLSLTTSSTSRTSTSSSISTSTSSRRSTISSTTSTTILITTQRKTTSITTTATTTKISTVNIANGIPCTKFGEWACAFGCICNYTNDEFGKHILEWACNPSSVSC
ncbi:hypothetical protein HDU79_010275 [Rhizoclosmatium sp. JEL0117]|nr:hypothetical protein HDU79_010275 [Rhizoclosmatium sp. JEL0117]